MDCKDGPNYKSEEFIHKKLKVDDFVVINITIIDRVVRNTNFMLYSTRRMTIFIKYSPSV